MAPSVCLRYRLLMYYSLFATQNKLYHTLIAKWHADN